MVLLALSGSTHVAQTQSMRYWNINQFPFRMTLLRSSLGSTNSRLIAHCLETLALAVVGVLTLLCCYCHQDLQ